MHSYNMGFCWWLDEWGRLHEVPNHTTSTDLCETEHEGKSSASVPPHSQRYLLVCSTTFCKDIWRLLYFVVPVARSADLTARTADSTLALCWWVWNVDIRAESYSNWNFSFSQTTAIKIPINFVTEQSTIFRISNSNFFLGGGRYSQLQYSGDTTAKTVTTLKKRCYTNHQRRSSLDECRAR